MTKHDDPDAVDLPPHVRRAEEWAAEQPFAADEEGAGAFKTRHRDTKTTRAEGLFVVRESDKYNDQLFDAMREQTYQLGIHIPSVAAVNELGLAPMTQDHFVVHVLLENGTFQERQVNVETITHKRAKVRIFELDGYWHVWARESAHQESEDEDGLHVNPFTRALVSTIRAKKPRVIHAAQASRLARNIGQANDLLAALPHNVDGVRIRDQYFDLTSHYRLTSMMFLFFMLWASAAERDTLVTRFTTGRIGAYNRDEWPYGNSKIPFGYQLLANGQLAPDLDKAEQVRTMLLILAHPSHSAGEKKRLLGDIGVKMMKRTPGSETEDDERQNVITAASAGTLISTLMAWAPLYVQGEYLYRLGGNFPKADRLAGAPISRHPNNENDPGEVQMLYVIEPPEPGWAWADSAVLNTFAEAARAHFVGSFEGRSQPRPVHPEILAESKDASFLQAILPSTYAQKRGPKSLGTNQQNLGRELKPAFSGRSWTDGHHDYTLNSYSKGYRITRRPKDAKDNSAGRAVAFIPYDRLLKNLNAAVVAALRDGVPTEFVPGLSAQTTDQTSFYLDEWEQNKTIVRRRLKETQARAKAGDEDSLLPGLMPEQKESLRAIAAEQHLRARRLADELADLELRRPTAADKDPDTFDMRTAIWEPAVRAFAGQTHLRTAKYEALNNVLKDFRLDRGPDGLWRGSLTLRVDTSEGVASIGPIRWHVGTGGGGTQEVTARHTAARHVTDYDKRQLRSRLVNIAKVTDEAAIVALNSPFAELPHVIIAGAALLAGDDDIKFRPWIGTKWRNPVFARWVATVYQDPEFNWYKNYSESSPKRQAAVDFILAHDPVSGRQLVEGVNLNLSTTETIRKFPLWSDGKPRPVSPSIRTLDDRARSYTEPVLTLHTCHEGHLGVTVTRVPEVLTDLLCEHGHHAGVSRRAFPADIEFPDEYQLLRVPVAEAAALTTEQFNQQKTAHLGKAQKTSLATLASHGPHTVKELLARFAADGYTMPSAGLYSALNDLRRYGLADQAPGKQPKKWLLTDEGRAHPEARTR